MDQAVVHAVEEVKIIHGIGTGRLRDAITELLRRHPQVRRFEAGDVGGGSTVVELEWHAHKATKDCQAVLAAAGIAECAV